jgi:Spy/CpxP family protein refolding chaperone
MEKFFVALLAFVLQGIVQAQELKAISPDRIDQYRAGAGMGYAQAAEQNHFPGPMHVLELADKLGLSAEQRAATERLMQAHKAHARAIGEQIVESERALEALFRAGRVNEAALARAVRTAATLEGEYRLSHLETHRRMRALLDEEQVKRYDVLRGHTGQLQGHPQRHKH